MRLNIWLERLDKDHSLYHHDLSDAFLERYKVHVMKVREVMQINAPFLIAEGELVNIIKSQSVLKQSSYNTTMR